MKDEMQGTLRDHTNHDVEPASFPLISIQTYIENLSLDQGNIYEGKYQETVEEFLLR